MLENKGLLLLGQMIPGGGIFLRFGELDGNRM